MKYYDLKRLALISIETKEKSTKNTVRGIILGLSILVPVVFFALSFNYSLNKEVDKMRTLASFNIISSVESNAISNVPDEGIIESVSKINGVDSVISGEYIIFDTKSNNTITIRFGNDPEDASYDFDFSLSNRDINPTIKICDTSKPLFSNAEHADVLGLSSSSSPYKAGFGFTNNGFGQVIISETILNYYGINPLMVIGSKISILYSGTQKDDIDIDDDPNNDPVSLVNTSVEVPLMVNYTIVGVLKEDFLGLASRINESHIWISNQSIMDEGEYLFPIMNNYTNDDVLKPLYTYTNTDFNELAANITNMGKVFFPIGYGINYSYNVDHEVYHNRVKSTIVQCDGFSKALNIEERITNEYRKLDIINYIPDQNPLYQQVRTISTMATYVMMVLIVFAMIILITTLLNLFNTITYSVDSRRHYIGVMKAIGAKKKNIVQMYFIELILLFKQTIIWVFCIGGIISVIIKYIVDEGLEKYNEIIPYDVKLNLWYFLVSFGFIIIFDFVIAFLFSHMACVKTNSKPILEILKDER
ncbi:MAG: FtsX-like permease family protein [Bacilli bacterium]